jgi:DNA polymerase
MAARSPREALAYLRKEKLGDCTRCALHKGRHTIVFGDGDSDADLMIVSDAPGAAEDWRGKPFVKRRGQLLEWFLEQVGLDRQQTYMTNLVKCIPKDHALTLVEVTTCAPFLHTQIWLVQPKVILAMGRAAGQMLTGQQIPLGRLRRGDWVYENASTKMRAPVVVTEHLSRVSKAVGSSVERATRNSVEDDFKKVLKYLQGD